jgi:transposase
VCRALQKLGLPRKKKRFFAQERSKKKRETFRQEIQGLDPRKFVFVDEMGVNTDLSRRYARAPKGQRVEEPLPRNTPANLSLAGALGARKLLASCCVEGAFDGEAFAVFIERMVVPQLEPGQTVLMDHVPTHPSQRVENAIQGAGAKLLNLPPYSPDWDPAESYWSKLKSILRGAKARTVAALYQAIGLAMKQVTAVDIHGWYKHAGYDFALG